MHLAIGQHREQSCAAKDIAYGYWGNMMITNTSDPFALSADDRVMSQRRQLAMLGYSLSLIRGKGFLSRVIGLNY